MPAGPTKTTPAKRAPKNKPAGVPVSADAAPIRVCTSDDYLDARVLEPLEKNPRTISAEKRASLVRSIRELGLFRPLLVWSRADGEAVVIGGNQRLPILKELVSAGTPLVHEDGQRAPGVPVTWFRGTEQQARIVALRDNANDGDWNYPLLTEYLSDLREGGADDALLALSGFDADALQDLAGAYAASSAPAPAPEPVPPAATPPAPPAVPTPTGPLQDPAEQLVGVTIGHIRGKIKAPTYERLVKVLTEGLASGIPEGGLDAAFAALLARLP